MGSLLEKSEDQGPGRERDSTSSLLSPRAEPAPKAQTGLPPALSCTAQLTQGGCTGIAHASSVWGGQSPRSQVTRSGGRSGNRLCCDATQNQGPVSQSHAGRSPLALKGLAGRIWTRLGVVQQPTIVWLGSGCQAKGRAVGQRGELGLAGTGVQKSVCLFTICAQIAGKSGPTLGVGGRVPVF